MNMERIKKLPEAEFEVMKIVWDNVPPITTNLLMQQLGNSKGWKTPSLISLLVRLTERGFLRSEKQGKERLYYPLIEKEEYLKFETEKFIKQYHGNSLSSLVASMSDHDEVTEEDLEELLKWAKERLK
jgi:BlaI family transcriptional regulator, penicillinase repressor